MISFLKKALIRIIPSHIHPYVLVNRIIEKAVGRTVYLGPFAGMKYVNSTSEGPYYPRLLGTYELELGPTIEELCQKSFDTIMAVGAAEGYYAVGLAIRNPQSRVIAFELNVKGQNLMRQMAKMNNIENTKERVLSKPKRGFDIR